MGSEFFFEVEFPFSNPENQIFESIVSPVINNDFMDNIKSDMNLLIVEDNEINMMLAKKMMSKILPGARVYEAKDGNQAIEVNEQNEIDLILMDVHMPIKDGYEATAEIRQNEKYKDLPIIALTAEIMNSEEKMY